MKKFTLLCLCVVCAAIFCFGAPFADAAAPEKPAKKKVVKENWDELFADGLFTADGKEFPLSNLKKKRYVGIYCSASWCGPCRAFTPKLVEFYKKNSAKIEIVLFGYDRTQEGIFQYMKDHEIPFPSLKFGSEARKDYARRYEINGIPSFILFDKTGKMLLQTRDLDAIRRTIKGK